MKLSIITINLNNSKGLKDTLNSVFSCQQFADFESIVIDGGSNDGSIEVINIFREKISYWVSEKDNGIYNAMNKGNMKSRGEYLLFLNSGDCLINNVLYKVFERDFDSDFIYGNCIQVYPDGRKQFVTMPSTLTFFDFYKGSLIHSATFIKRKSMILYNENLKIVSDWEFFLKKIILENASCHYLDFPISEFDMTGISSSDKYRKIQNSERTQILESCIPIRILEDYKVFQLSDTLRNNEILMNILSQNVSPSFRIFLCELISFICKIYFFVKRWL